jgi:hypothetical protein
MNGEVRERTLRLALEQFCVFGTENVVCFDDAFTSESWKI